MKVKVSLAVTNKCNNTCSRDNELLDAIASVDKGRGPRKKSVKSLVFYQTLLGPTPPPWIVFCCWKNKNIKCFFAIFNLAPPPPPPPPPGLVKDQTFYRLFFSVPFPKSVRYRSPVSLVSPLTLVTVFSTVEIFCKILQKFAKFIQHFAHFAQL